MKKNAEKIYMQDWLSLHGYQQSSADDQWYLNFAQNLIPTLRESSILRDFSFDEYRDLALLLTVYFEDAVSVKGGWIRFRDQIKCLYNRMLPFYKVDLSSYYEDEINEDDIKFVIWSFLSCPQDGVGDDYIIIDPFDRGIILLAQNIYSQMDQSFEDAPVTKGESIDWIMDMDQLSRKIKEMPSIDIEHCKSVSAKRLLENSKGYPLQFFATYKDLARFFVDVLLWEDKEESLMPEMKELSNFVLFANNKGLLLAPEAAIYFNSPHNALYDVERAKEESYVLFVEQGACPYDLLKYGIMQGYLSDANLPIPNGDLILKENQDFISRWYLGEYYEGD